MNPLADIDWTNPAVAVDAAVRNFIKSKLPQVDATAHPGLAAAITQLENDGVTAAEEAIKAYALPLLLKQAGPVLDGIAAKFPAVAPEIAAVKAKIGV